MKIHIERCDVAKQALGEMITALKVCVFYKLEVNQQAAHGREAKLIKAGRPS